MRRLPTIIALIMGLGACSKPASNEAAQMAAQFAPTSAPANVPKDLDYLGRETGEEWDYWSYVPDHDAKGPAAELVMWNSGDLAFRVACDRGGQALLIEFFNVDAGELALRGDKGLDLILQQDGPDFERKTYSTSSSVVADHISGVLKLDASLAREIEQAPHILLYGDNGPSNDYEGGPAAALRRVVRECVA